MRAPTMFNLRMDPYERAEITSNTYNDFLLRRSFLSCPHRRSLSSSSIRSRNSRRARSRRASASIRSWSSWRSRQAAELTMPRRPASVDGPARCPLWSKSSLYRFQVTDSVNSRRSSLGWRIAGLEVHPDAPERSVDLQHVSFSSMEAVVLCAVAHVKIVNMQDVRRKAGRGC